MKWVNFGGGHHISRADYDVDLLCKLVSDFHDKYGVQVYLEPGEAIALGTGVLVATVDRYRGQRRSGCHPRHLRHLPHARCAGDALPSGHRSAQACRSEHTHTYRLGGPELPGRAT